MKKARNFYGYIGILSYIILEKTENSGILEPFTAFHTNIDRYSEIYEAFKSFLPARCVAKVLGDICARFNGAEKFINGGTEKTCSCEKLFIEEVNYFASFPVALKIVACYEIKEPVELRFNMFCLLDMSY